MLNTISTTTTPTLRQAWEAGRSIKVITGQSLAKADRMPRQRARAAADWIRGEVRLVPGLKLAAAVFGVSQPLVSEELKAKNGTPPLSEIDSAWACADCEEFARASDRTVGPDRQDHCVN
jgi:hypothetical protein